MAARTREIPWRRFGSACTRAALPVIPACRKESPKGWVCQLENEQLTAEPGRFARCKRKGDGAVAILIFLGESSSGDRQVARSSCNSIKLGEPRIFYKENMACGRAKRYARTLYRSGGKNEPRNFSCESGSNFDEGGGCRHDFRNEYFGWHPAD